MEERDILHPRKIDSNGNRVKFPICSTNFGVHGLGESTSEISNYGVGVVLYFKFVASSPILLHLSNPHLIINIGRSALSY